MGLFDDIQSNLWNPIRRWYGQAATWTPTVGPPVQGIMLFRNPTTEERLLFAENYPEMAVCEWQLGKFVGLYEALRGDANGVTPQAIEVHGANYLAFQVEALADGKTYKAYLDRT